ncbi:PREDICTED: F-box/LRR-repeat protein At3g03360-like [Camelina sativa]|uniref:F-box/LRR-repeat protein At3g03360-like n=1 Tax=Camelina sativa TaxID=90675 RepID=A0ABM0YY27_CAMSA|nr:PREDICTED: F-box/LRR-repeat protein At3g03360-like [Camelina sativa]
MYDGFKRSRTDIKQEHLVLTVLGSRSQPRSWRRVENPPGEPYTDVQGGICINGSIYYGVGDTKKIAEFDLRSERMMFINAPAKDDIKSWNFINHQGELGVIKCDYLYNEMRVWIQEKEELWNNMACAVPCEWGALLRDKRPSCPGEIHTGEVMLVSNRLESSKPFSVFYCDVSQESCRSAQVEGIADDWFRSFHGIGKQDRDTFCFPGFKVVIVDSIMFDFRQDFDDLVQRTRAITGLIRAPTESFCIGTNPLPKILCGCPILESLRLYGLTQLNVLDLSKSLRLRVLEIHLFGVKGPIHIVEPFIHYLSLTSTQLPCTLVVVSSLTKVKLDFYFTSFTELLDADDFLQVLALEMLEKLKNVEKLTFGENFLKILSLVELRGVSFPILKAQVLTLKTNFSQYVMHGIVRVLQNSPELMKLTLKHKSNRGMSIIPDKHLDYYLYSHSLNLNRYRVLRKTWPLESKHVASFMKILLENTKRLEKMVVIGLKDYQKGRFFKELLQMVPVLSHDNM